MTSSESDSRAVARLLGGCLLVFGTTTAIVWAIDAVAPRTVAAAVGVVIIGFALLGWGIDQ